MKQPDKRKAINLSKCKAVQAKQETSSLYDNFGHIRPFLTECEKVADRSTKLVIPS